MSHKLFICETCMTKDQAVPGPDLIAVLQARVADLPALAELTVVGTACLNICDEPVSMALRAPNKMAYLFSDIHPGDLDDILALAGLYLNAPGGVIEDARPAGRLRFCLKGRVPAL